MHRFDSQHQAPSSAAFTIWENMRAVRIVPRFHGYLTVAVVPAHYACDMAEPSLSLAAGARFRDNQIVGSVAGRSPRPASTQIQCADAVCTCQIHITDA